MYPSEVYIGVSEGDFMNGFNSPGEIAQSVVGMGEKKVGLSFTTMLVLGLLAGAYIAFGAQLATMVTHDLAGKLGVGFAKFLGGSVFSVGLMLVVIGGAELFTGNNLIITGVLARTVGLKGMFRNWGVVYIANFIGSILLVFIIFYSGLWKTNNFGVGTKALLIANSKVNLSFLEALCRGIACNWLVCLAVWLALAGKDIVSKILGIYFPIMAFVASGFEHSIANMYFIPMGMFLKGVPEVMTAVGNISVQNLTWYGFLVKNLVPVTIGNIIGGAFFTGTLYWFTYHKGVASK